MSEALASGQVLDPEEEAFAQELDRRAADRLRKRLAAIGAEGVAWLALAPSWTTRLAAACELPTGKSTLDEFIDAAEAAGLCVTGRPTSSATGRANELRILTALAPYLPDRLVERALDLLEKTSEDRLCAGAIADLAPALEADRLARAAGRAERIGAPIDRAIAFTALLGSAPEDQRAELLDAAVSAAWSTELDDARARLLAALALLAGGEQAAELSRATLDAARALQDPQERASLLVGVAHLVGEDRLPEIVASVRAVADVGVRVELELALLRHLSAREKGDILVEAARWSSDAGTTAARSAARLALVDALAAEGELQVAEEIADSIEQDDTRASAFGRLAFHRASAGDQEETRRLVGRAIRAVTDTVGTWRALSVRVRIAWMLVAAGDREGALSLARDDAETATPLGGGTETIQPLRELSRLLAFLGETELARTLAESALALAAQIGGLRERCESVLLLVPMLPQEKQAEAIAAARRATESIGDPLDRVVLLRMLLPHVDEEERGKLIDDVLAQADAWGRDRAVWMPDTVRADVVKLLAGSDGGDTHVDLVATSADIATRMLDARQRGVPIAAPVARWAKLAQALRAGSEDVGPVALAFQHEVSVALGPGDVAAALDWIDTGAALAETLGDKFDGAVRYARRRIELVYRDLEDRLHPEPFLERQEHEDAFRDLRADSGSAWALHFVGPGGVGKSMLLRHLTGQAPELGIVTAKIDFDYLKPDYPVRRPAQLLVELMAELELHAEGTRAESLIRSFHESVVELHEESLASEPADPLVHLSDTQFDSALRAFCDYLKILGRPVVLFLDTCEELSRFQPAGGRAFNLEAAFGVMERIHEAVPTVRVVFAGRRLLTHVGYGWHVAHRPSFQLANRPYLRLHEIRGFDESEARRFLENIRKLELEPDLLEAILDGSRSTQRASDVVWVVPRAVRIESRHNPFDLARYADWVAEEDVGAEALTSSEADPYVHRRIVGRIRSDAVRQLLPAVALVQRFDRELLRPAFSGTDAAFEQAFAELARLEWITPVLDGQSRATTALQVDPLLQTRLLKYFMEEGRRPHLTRASRALSRGIAQRIDRTALGDLSIEDLDRATRALVPGQAAALWNRLSLRIASEERWDWARQVAGRLLSDEGSVASAEHPARAAVSATYAAASLHSSEAIDLTSHWTAVLTATSSEPDAAARSWLEARARAGLVAADKAAAGDAITAFVQVLRSFPGGPDATDREVQRARMDQLAAAYCAALDALADRTPANDEPPVDGEAVRAWTRRLDNLDVSPAVCAFAHALAAGWPGAHEDRMEVGAHLSAAEDRIAELGSPTAQRWLDWVAPSSLPDRIRIELLRLGGARTSQDLARWQEEALERSTSIDAERLVSAVLRIDLANGLVEESELERLSAADVYDPWRQPTCRAHGAIRALFAQLSLGWLARGDARRALIELDARAAAAADSASDLETIREAELAKLEVLRRMRIEGEEAVLDRLARSTDPAEIEAALAVIALTSAPSRLAAAEGDEPRWRYQTALTPGGLSRLEASAGERWGTAGAEQLIGPVDEVLDATEWGLLLSGTRRRGPRFPADGLPADDGDNGERAARRTLRATALGALEEPARGRKLPEDDQPPLSDFADRIGRRRLGELALEEGELLALRLPREAVPLLQYAVACFTRAGDPVGTLLALVRSTIAMAHARDATVDRRRLGVELESAYEAVLQAGSIPNGPRLGELVDQAGAEARTPPEAVASRWDGWLGRLRLASLWCRNAVPTPVEPDPVIELDLTAGREAEQRSRSGAVARVAGALLMVVVVGVFVALFTVAAYLVRTGLNVVSVEIPWWGALAVVAGLVAVGVGVRFWLDSVRTGMRKAAAARTALRFAVLAPSPTTSEGTPWPPPIPLTVRLWQRRAAGAAKVTSRKAGLVAAYEMVTALLGSRSLRFLRLGDVVETTGIWVSPPLGPYRPGAGDFPADIADQLRELLHAVGRGRFTVPVEVPGDLGGLPWEAFLATASEPSRGSGTVEVFRRAEPLGTEPSRVPRDGVVAVAADRTWARLATGPWTASGFRVSSPIGPRPAAGLVDLVHGIGRAVGSPRGYRLQVAGDVQRGVASEQAVRASGTLLTPEALANNWGPLVVLQAEPYEIDVRLDTDREDAARLKLLGAEVFSAGAWAVLVLPALPPAVAADSVAIFARRWRRKSPFRPSHWVEAWTLESERRLGVRADPDVRRLLRAVAEMRAHIAKAAEPGSPGPPNPAAIELAHDVCLFARDELADFEPPDSPSSGSATS